MNEQAPGSAPGIAVGTRVRERVPSEVRPPMNGTVVATDVAGPGTFRVAWDGGWSDIMNRSSLELIAPAVRPDAPAFPPGTVVRYRAGLVNLRGWDVTTGVVQSGGLGGDREHVLVQWEHCPEPDWEAVANLEAVVMPPAHPPEPHVHPDGSRILAPGIWTHPGRRGGIPCIEGRRVGCDSVYGGWEAGIARWDTMAEWEITEPEYIAAVAFEAGVRWEKARRKAKQEERTDGR